MATLSVTHSYIAGTLAKASEVNTNFTDIINWSAGNIQNDNIGTLSGVISWSISTGVQAISVANSGNQGSMTLTQSVAMNASKSGIKMSHTAAETSGDAGLFIDFTSASSSIPLLLLKNNGTGKSLVIQDGSAVEQQAINKDGSFTKPIELTSGGATMTNSSGNVEFSAGIKIGSSGPTITSSGTDAIFSGDIQADGDAVRLGSGGPTLTNVGGGRIDSSGDLRAGGDLSFNGDTFTIDANGNAHTITNAGASTVSVNVDLRANSSKAVPVMPTGTASTVIAGVVSSGGAVQQGDGFSAAKNSAGNYTVTYDTAFASDAAVVVTPSDAAANAMGTVRASSTSSFTVEFVTLSVAAGPVLNQTPTDIQFRFVVIGDK